MHVTLSRQPLAYNRKCGNVLWKELWIGEIFGWRNAGKVYGPFTNEELVREALEEASDSVNHLP